MIRKPKARRAASALSYSKSPGRVQPSITRVHRTPSCELRTPMGRRSIS
jgi:hypothetical protein